jgi:hypothetical protein
MVAKSPKPGQRALEFVDNGLELRVHWGELYAATPNSQLTHAANPHIRGVGAWIRLAVGS